MLLMKAERHNSDRIGDFAKTGEEALSIQMLDLSRFRCALTDIYQMAHIIRGGKIWRPARPK